MDEVLVVYDPLFKYGQNFYLVTSEEQKQAMLNVSVSFHKCRCSVKEKQAMLNVSVSFLTNADVL